jgi:hypothetical protein
MVTLLAQSETYTVQSPKPLADAIKIIERRCECVITYEDPIYDVSVLVDWTAVVRKDGKAEPKIFAPPERLYSFDYHSLGLTRDTTRKAAAVRVFVDAFNRHDTLDNFTVTESDDMVHVAPGGQSKSILRVEVSVPEFNGTVLDGITNTLKLVSVATGKNAAIATAPLALLQRTMLHSEPTTDSAERILTRMMRQTGQQLSWQLFYDYNLKVYGFNLHSVP